MGDGEDGDNLEQVPKSPPELGHGLPAVFLEQHYGRENQREEKQDVVDSDPDMQDTLGDHLTRRDQSRNIVQIQYLIGI